MTEEEEGACSTSAAHHSAVALQGLLSSHGAAQVISKVSLMEKDLKRSQRTLSELRSAQQTAGADAEQAARAHEEALGAARLEAKEAREVHGVLEKECAAKDEIERVISTAGARACDGGRAATAARERRGGGALQRRDRGRCCGRGCGRGRFGHHGGERPPPVAAAPLSAAVAASTRWNCHPGTRRLSRRRADLCKFGLSCAKEARRALLAQTQAGAADVVQVAVRIQL